MKFNDTKPIYLQIVELMGNNIISKQWGETQRIPSVREMGVTLAVNPATVLRAYEHLSSLEIIEQRRGIGYFVAEGGIDKIVEIRKKEFLEQLPRLFEEMESLNLSLTDLEKCYSVYKGE